jgi:hypothetical protein
MRYVSTERPRLAPIFRSDTQLKILAATYLEPERQFSIPELVERSGRPQPTVAREVERMADEGLLESSLTQGRRTVRAAGNSPIFEELRSILIKTVGPKTVLERRLSGLVEIHHAFIYGSWAKRYHGEGTASPQDVDLLIVGPIDVVTIRQAADAASRELGRDVNPTVLSDEDWADARSGFLQQVKTGPLVELELHS